MADNFRLYRALVSFQTSRVLREKNYASWIAAFLSSLECRFLPRRTRKLSFFLSLFDLPSFFLFLQRYFQICFHKSTWCLVISICTRKIENSSSLQIPLTLSFELSIRFLVNGGEEARFTSAKKNLIWDIQFWEYYINLQQINLRLLSSQIAINFITLDQSPTPSFQIREKSLNSFDINNPTSPSTPPPHLFPSRGKSKRKRRNSHEKRLHVSMTTTDVYTCTSGEQRKIEREREDERADTLWNRLPLWSSRGAD